jgi:hypothetical protein
MICDQSMGLGFLLYKRRFSTAGLMQFARQETEAIRLKLTIEEREGSI